MTKVDVLCMHACMLCMLLYLHLQDCLVAAAVTRLGDRRWRRNCDVVGTTYQQQQQQASTRGLSRLAHGAEGRQGV